MFGKCSSIDQNYVSQSESAADCALICCFLMNSKEIFCLNGGWVGGREKERGTIQLFPP